MPFKQKDFIEVEFTGRIKDGEVFDSNIKKELEKINANAKAKPFIFCLGEDMFLKGIEDFLINKKIGKYKIELSPEKAFGKRNSNLIQLIPMKIFKEQKAEPIPGAMFNFDGRPAKILTVSGGRVMADFNNPLAGKTVVYDINVKRKVDDLDEKIKALIDFFFKKELKFQVKDKKIILHIEKALVDYSKIFKDKFKDVLGLELEIQEIDNSTKKSQ
ncbi:peptidylprolyl isomerase [Candidatus Pacearchaeota archaeon]|nr:peptidylprolyl isomerase [Candidatus Pacearchaeota archaeon]